MEESSPCHHPKEGYKAAYLTGWNNSGQLTIPWEKNYCISWFLGAEVCCGACWALVPSSLQRMRLFGWKQRRTEYLGG